MHPSLSPRRGGSSTKAPWGRWGDSSAGLRTSRRSRSALPRGWQPGFLGRGAPPTAQGGGCGPSQPPAPTRTASASALASLICNLQGD